MRALRPELDGQEWRRFLANTHLCNCRLDEQAIKGKNLENQFFQFRKF
jgi:hypothetical protein